MGGLVVLGLVVFAKWFFPGAFWLGVFFTVFLARYFCSGVVVSVL